MKEFKVKRGDEILIELSGSKFKVQSIAGAPHAKGIIPLRRNSDYLPRRKKKSGLFNFYDVGQVKNLDTGRFEDLAFNVSEGYNTIPEPVPFASWANYYDLIFSIPLNQWKDKYRKVEYSEIEKYGIYLGNDLITTDIEEWTEAGLKYDFDGLRFFTRAIAHPILMEFDPTNYKITKENNFAATETSFNPKKGGDLFLFPRIFRREVEELNDAGNNGLLWANYGILSREFWLEKTETDFSGTHPIFQSDSFGATLDAGTATALDNFLKGYSTADYYTWTGSNQSTGSFVSKTLYPSVGGAGAVKTYRIRSLYKNSNNFAPFSNKLIAVIMQGGQTYYIWVKNITSYSINDVTWHPHR